MCINPKIAWREKEGDKLSFSLPVPDGAERLYVNCGKCLECQDNYSKEWALRCALESQNHLDNCFITLTYADAPDSVSKRDFQLFMKRLRKKLEPLKIKYFGCGEYGDLKGRPHYHINVFGWLPDDLSYWCKSKTGHKIYRSKTLEDCWPFGYCYVEEMSFHTAKYTALYMQKFLSFENKEKPFVLMSKGLAKNSIKSDMLKDGKVYYNSSWYTLPRYFVKKLSEVIDTSDYKLRRRKLADFSSSCVSKETLKNRYLKQYELVEQLKLKNYVKHSKPEAFKYIKDYKQALYIIQSRRKFIKEIMENGLTYIEDCDMFDT